MLHYIAIIRLVSYNRVAIFFTIIRFPICSLLLNFISFIPVFFTVVYFANFYSLKFNIFFSFFIFFFFLFINIVLSFGFVQHEGGCNSVLY